MFHMGSGIFQVHTYLKEELKKVKLGIDFCFDSIHSTLGITFCYKKERASDNAMISDHINRRKEQSNERSSSRSRNYSNPARVRAYSSSSHNFKSTIKAGAVFNYNG